LLLNYSKREERSGLMAKTTEATKKSNAPQKVLKSTNPDGLIQINMRTEIKRGMLMLLVEKTGAFIEAFDHGTVFNVDISIKVKDLPES